MHLNSARNTKLASVGERKEDQGLEEMNKEIRSVGREERGRSKMGATWGEWLFAGLKSRSSKETEKYVVETAPGEGQQAQLKRCCPVTSKEDPNL